VTLAALALLLWLGAWQWERMAWKAGLLNELAKAQVAAPVALTNVPRSIGADSNLADLRFRRIQVRGTFEHDREMHVWAPGVKPAWSVVTPLRLKRDDVAGADASRKPASHILVVRGVVPDVRKAAALRQAGQVAGEVNVTGRVRLDQPNTWANDPNTKKNQWFTRDVAVMTKYLAGSSGHDAIAVAPFFLEAETQMGEASGPQPDLKSLKLANRHLEYALTWWGLAATLAVVFAIFAWGRLQSARR